MRLWMARLKRGKLLPFLPLTKHGGSDDPAGNLEP